jgi:hypothetical protein
VIQLTDDEKFLFKADLKLEECHRWVKQHNLVEWSGDRWLMMIDALCTGVSTVVLLLIQQLDCQ